MRIRPYRERDISCIKEWVTSKRVHDMWCAGRLPYAFGEEKWGRYLLCINRTKEK